MGPYTIFFGAGSGIKKFHAINHTELPQNIVISPRPLLHAFLFCSNTQ